MFRKAPLLTPQHIADIRHDMGLTAAEMCQLLGLKSVTEWYKYEADPDITATARPPSVYLQYLLILTYDFWVKNGKLPDYDRISRRLLRRLKYRQEGRAADPFSGLQDAFDDQGIERYVSNEDDLAPRQIRDLQNMTPAKRLLLLEADMGPSVKNVEDLTERQMWCLHNMTPAQRQAWLDKKFSHHEED